MRVKKIIPQDLFNQYDAFLFDLWGVVHDGFEAYPGAVECINKLINLKKEIIFISNAPRPNTVSIQKLLELGIKVDLDMILTSGDVVRDRLKNQSDLFFKNVKMSCYHLGAERNQDLLKDIPIEVTDTLEEAGFLLISAFLEEEESLTQHDALLKKAVALNIPAVCANPDKVVVHGHKKRLCAGVISERLEFFGGKLHYYGKPHSAIFEDALIKLNKKGITNKKKIIMIGDTLETDIKGAYEMGIDSVLVPTGNGKDYSDTINNSNHKISEITPTYFGSLFGRTQSSDPSAV